MRLTTRVALGLALLTLLVVGVGAYQLSLVRRLAAEHRAFTEITFEALARETRARADVARLRDLGRKLVALRDPAYARALARARESAAANLDRLAELDLSVAEDERLRRLREVWTAYSTGAAAAADELSGLRTAAPPAAAEALVDALGRVAEALDALEEASADHLEEMVAQSERRVRIAERWAWIAGGTASLLALAIAAIVVVPLGSALGSLREGTVQLAAGNFDHRVRDGGGPELSRLAASFNAMALRLGDLDRLKRDFVSAVSHDLKGPLAAIEETTSLLLEEVAGPLTERQRRLLELDRTSCRRLRRMIGDLLDRARLDAGGWDYELRPCDLAELCREAMGASAASAERREVELRLDCPYRSPTLTADPSSLQRVLDNLLANAVRFAPAGSRVEVAVRHHPIGELPERVRRLGPPPAVEGWSIEVRDSGPGIDDADKERIFQRFQRVSGSAGLGLGLSIARSVIRAHGGSIWVEDADGGGSRFRVFLWPEPHPGWAEERLLAAVRGAGAERARSSSGEGR